MTRSRTSSSLFEKVKWAAIFEAKKYMMSPTSKVFAALVSARIMPATIDPRRIFLGYLFFIFGVLLTLYQYWHLISYGPMLPWLRQISIIVVNIMAVYIGVVLVYPWHTRNRNEYAGPRHFQRMMAVSLLFCLVTMIGLSLSLIMGPETQMPTTGTIGTDIFGPGIPDTPVSSFPWASYAIAGNYMVGYGVIGVGPWIIRWLLNQVTGNATAASPEINERETPQPKPARKKAYPIETRFVVGRVRKKKRATRKDSEDTAQD